MAREDASIDMDSSLGEKHNFQTAAQTCSQGIMLNLVAMVVSVPDHPAAPRF